MQFYILGRNGEPVKESRMQTHQAFLSGRFKRFVLRTDLIEQSALCLTLAACGSDGSSSPDSAVGAGASTGNSPGNGALSNVTYNLRGTLSGLDSGLSLSLRNNGADALTLKANGGFTFPSRAGSGASGAQDGPGVSATFSNPAGVAVGANGAVYVSDTGNNKIRKLMPTPQTRTGLLGDSAVQPVLSGARAQVRVASLCLACHPGRACTVFRCRAAHSPSAPGTGPITHVIVGCRRRVWYGTRRRQRAIERRQLAWLRRRHRRCMHKRRPPNSPVSEMPGNSSRSGPSTRPCTPAAAWKVVSLTTSQKMKKPAHGRLWLNLRTSCHLTFTN
ncbi:hypothetical protein [Cupriavidus basilensis]|uniref:hypothetical protein n=1 Tax=Cupriavidus basilensis TaxID=68895 RepID=UPI00157AD2BC|nr:hypothetical protein [Cupriavidus basilensis]